MDGRIIYEKFTSIPFALTAESFTECKDFSFNTHEEAVEFLSLYGVLLEEKKHKDYNEERYLHNYKRFEDALQKNGFFEIGAKKYSIILETSCSMK